MALHPNGRLDQSPKIVPEFIQRRVRAGRHALRQLLRVAAPAERVRAEVDDQHHEHVRVEQRCAVELPLCHLEPPAEFDQHPIGTTVVNPTWAQPRFLDLTRDDYRVIGTAVGQRFSSPTIDTGDPLADQALPSSYVNLLTNPGFESGLTGWTVSPGGTGGTQSME